MKVKIRNKEVYLGVLIGKGAEGNVYKIDDNTVAKIYHNKDRLNADKLLTLKSNIPSDPSVNKNHISFTFPIDLVCDDDHHIIGYTMHFVNNAKTLIEVYNPKLRKRNGIKIDLRFLYVMAINLCAVMEVLHLNDFVVGDLKPQNVLVTKEGLVTLIDIDSIQIKHNDEYYVCSVGTVDTTPPELMYSNFKDIIQEKYHDNFRLGVLIYLILLGEYPFIDLNNLSKSKKDNILELNWVLTQPFDDNHLVNSVSESLPVLFKKCFSLDYKGRPSATEWKKVLIKDYRNLVQCKNNSEHYHLNTSYDCFWCGIENNLQLLTAAKNEKKQVVFELNRISLYKKEDILDKLLLFSGNIKKVTTLKKYIRLEMYDYSPCSSKYTSVRIEILISGLTYKQLNELEESTDQSIQVKGKLEIVKSRVNEYLTIYLSEYDFDNNIKISNY